MPINRQATTQQLSSPTTFGKGTSSTAKPGFPVTADQLAPPSTLWSDYRDNVLRGDTDSLSSPAESVEANRTFSRNSPPRVRATEAPSCEDENGNSITYGEAGSPLGGMCPPVVPPFGGGTDASNIPEHQRILRSFVVAGDGSGANGSALDPEAASEYQEAQATYDLGRWSRVG